MKKPTKAYLKYREKFYAEKKIGNVKNGVRVLSSYQYKRAKKENINDTEILDAQTILHSKAQKNKIWRDYKKIKKTFERGETVSREEMLFNETEYESELKYHYNLSGLLKDRDFLHYIITDRIVTGEDREGVLADYGY